MGHTIGSRPRTFADASADVKLDADGALHATLSQSVTSTYSGFIAFAPEEVPRFATPPPGPTRFRVTFTGAGTYPFICALHDGLGRTARSS